MTMQDTHERPATDEMAVVHRVFRRELGTLPALVRAVPAGDRSRAGVVAEHARLMLAGLHMHHTGEDAVLWPLLLERAAPRRDLIELMQAQHAEVERLTRIIATLVERFAATAMGGEQLASAVEDLHAALVEHLAAEEAEIVPLAGQHLTVAEWNAMGQNALGEMSRKQLPLLFGAVLEETDARERAMMMSVLPAPARLFMASIGAVLYRRYIARVREGLAI
jgi:iron-sulfur cluster repair protein YtfE (RIC family)